jgi:hypothetical protein
MLRNLLLAVTLGGLSFAAPPAFSAAREAVDIELVIATDVSPSIDPDEARLQRQGIIGAFLDPKIVQAIEAGSLGRIGVAYIDFSAREYNRIVVNWRVIHDKDTATQFAEALRRAPPTLGRHTSISDAIELGALMLEANDFDGTRRVIDISGDGPNNWGRDITTVRDEAVAKGIIINGLPILPENPYGFGGIPDLDRYYANCVIGGRGAFIVPAKGFQDFSRAIRNKLILEIASAAPEQPRLIKAAEERLVPNLNVGPRTGIRPLLAPTCANGYGFGGFDFPPPR